MYYIIYGLGIGWILATLIGFIIHKVKPSIAPTWEDGVKKIFTWIYDLYCEEISGKQIPSQMINSALLLVNEEIRKFPKLFEDHPFDTPIFNFLPDVRNGIAWYDIGAVGLISKYRDITNEQIAQICSHVIQNYFFETRGTYVCLYIKVATPTRLYFAIALSEEGKKFLDMQEAKKQQGNPAVKRPAPLEEEINLFDMEERK